MKIDELDRSLPNGFHDALLLSFTARLERQAVEFELDVWIGHPDEQPPRRDLYRSARLLLAGITYFAVDPTGVGSSTWRARSPMIDLCEPDPAVSPHATIPQGGFSARFFVADWNAFIHFAAKDAQLTWMDGV